MTLYTESGLCLAGVAVVWFLNGIYRLHRLTKSGDHYVAKFAEMCDDDNIPLILLDVAQASFKASSASNLAPYIFGWATMRKRNIDVVAQIRGMPPESALRVGEGYFLLLNHLSYRTPIFGFVLRRFLLGRRPESATNEDRTRLISAVDVLLHAT